MSDFDAEPRTRSETGRQTRECPSCGRRIYLNREGAYRRHFAAESDGRRHLCAASGHLPPVDPVSAILGGENQPF